MVEIKKLYTYKPSGIEWFGDTPDHWVIKRLYGICNFVRGNSTFQKNELLNQGKYIALQYGKTYKVEEINEQFKFFVNDEFYKSSQIVNYEDVIFVSTSETIEDLGHSVYYNRKDIGLIGGEQILLKPNKNILKGKYLFYSSKVFGKELNKFATGIKVFRFDIYDLKTIYTSIPPLPEQIAITDYLDKATSKIDRIIEIKKEQLEMIEIMFQDKVMELLSGKNYVNHKQTRELWIKKIPKSWKVAKLSHLIEVKDGTHDTPSYEDTPEGNFPFVTSKDITNNKIDFSHTKFISPLFHKNYYRRSNPKRGDIIMPMIGTLGNCAIVDTDMEFSIKNVALFKTSESKKINAHYLYFFLESKLNGNQFYLLSKGGVQAFLSLTVLRNLKVILPSKEEQESIVSQLLTYNNKLNKIMTNIEGQVSTLLAYRKSLIHECVTGKKQVCEPHISIPKPDKILT
jgi:type I restriction enzyme, S subunit